MGNVNLPKDSAQSVNEVIGGRVFPKIGVVNRDYHHLSQIEIDGRKRISRHLSGQAHFGSVVFV